MNKLRIASAVAALTSALALPVWSANAADATNNGTANLLFTGSTRLTPNVDVFYSINSLAFDSSAGAFVLGGSQITIP